MRILVYASGMRSLIAVSPGTTRCSAVGPGAVAVIRNLEAEIRNVLDKH